jgi:hypothetical protein
VRLQSAALARDHGISWTTAYRYLDEVIAVLAEQTPDLHQALERAYGEGLAHVILDGKIIPCDRCKEPAFSVKGQVIDIWYFGKAHTHGGNIQVVLAPDGFPLWVSPVELGSVRDLTAARALPALYRAAAVLLPSIVFWPSLCTTVMTAGRDPERGAGARPASAWAGTQPPRPAKARRSPASPASWACGPGGRTGTAPLAWRCLRQSAPVCVATCFLEKATHRSRRSPLRVSPSPASG